jgi:catechol-2,3-dioxygenase
MNITSINHKVLTVKHIDTTMQFYDSVLGLETEIFDNGRAALKLGNQKINLHEQGQKNRTRSQESSFEFYRSMFHN